MTPFRANFNYKVTVKTDPDNPNHRAYYGMEEAEENRSVSGFVTDVLVLNDSFTSLVASSAGETKSYQEVPMTKGGVYVVFWKDMGNYYQMTVQDYNSITMSKRDMINYVNKV
jgi:hypothetical protein